MKRETERKEQERKKSQQVEFVSSGVQAGAPAILPKVNVPVAGWKAIHVNVVKDWLEQLYNGIAVTFHVLMNLLLQVFQLPLLVACDRVILLLGMAGRTKNQNGIRSNLLLHVSIHY